MAGPAPSGLERAVFGDAGRLEIDDWLDRHVRSRLSAGVRAVEFRSGRISPVYGLRLSDGSAVVAKVHRDPVDVDRLAGAVACQAVLADAGFPCPRPLDGPAATGGRVAVLETLVERGERGDAHAPAIRLALARSLFEQVELLRGVPAAPLAAGGPAWTVYDDGPWPVPHDPIFDFSATPPGFAWLDDLARRAAGVLGPRTPDVLAHGDWVCQNVRFDGAGVAVAYDWDSLFAAPEPVLAGIAAGAFTEGGTEGDVAPAPDDAAAFLADYDAQRPRPFTTPQQRAAAAAAAWVLAYNARCGVGFPHADGAALDRLERHGDAYLRLRW